MPDVECRLAKLEERVDMMHELAGERRRQSDQLMEKLDEIQRELTRMKGFTAGVAMTFSIIGAVASAAWDRLSS